MRVILISNFDITTSEIQYDYDFSSFVKIDFPSMEAEEVKNILFNTLSGKYYDITNFEEIIDTCVKNYNYNIANLNEIIFNTSQNLESFKNIQPTKKISSLVEETRKKNKKISNKEDNQNPNENNAMEDEDDIQPNQEYTQDNLRKNIKNQVRYAPIHIIKLDSFLKFNSKKGIIDLLGEEEEFGDNTSLKTKNLTDSLSKSEKILLLASYLASEISPKNDIKLFQAQRGKTGRKSRKKNNSGGLNLRANARNPFNVHRLQAIYQSLLSSIEEDFENDDIMLKCEIENLVKLGLIRSATNLDFKTIDQKYFSGINLGLATKIAEDYGIKVEDYINVEKME